MDRRIQESKRRLVGALRALMQRYPWENLSVAMVCQESNVSRSTYYSHFSNKQELLELSIKHLAEELVPEDPRRGLDTTGSFRFLPPLLTHIKSHREIFVHNQHRAAAGLIYKNLRKTTDGLAANEVLVSKFSSAVNADRLRFLCGGMSALIENWNDGACSEPEDIVLARLDATVIDFLNSTQTLSRPT